MVEKAKLVILADGKGSLFSHIVQKCRQGELLAKVLALVTAQPNAEVIKKAKDLGIPFYVVDFKGFASFEQWDRALLKQIKSLDPFFSVAEGSYRRMGAGGDSFSSTSLVEGSYRRMGAGRYPSPRGGAGRYPSPRGGAVLLAGFLKKIGPITLAKFEGRMINIHPSLLPRHGGLGMYGLRVHTSVIEAGDTKTGISVHLVSAEYDKGSLLAQMEIPVLPTDTPESLQARVKQKEPGFYVDTVKKFLAPAPFSPPDRGGHPTGGQGGFGNPLDKPEKHFMQDSFCQFFGQSFKAFLKSHFQSVPCLSLKGHSLLKKAMEYTVLSDGKYFRPLLIGGVAQWAGLPVRPFLPWAGAIEMAHSASLIHDDLPCMDNSLHRRGRASNHRVFGEDIALLAGNSLWIEAFSLISIYADQKQKGVWLGLLCKALGFNGLQGGQALDLKAPVNATADYLKSTHKLKTGQLIRVGMEGVLAVPNVGVDSQMQERLKTASGLIGQAFQLADDLDDLKNPAPNIPAPNIKEEKSNFALVHGQKATQARLLELSHRAIKCLELEESDLLLKKLIVWLSQKAL